MIKIDFKTIKSPLIVFVIFIILSMTVPFILPAKFFGAYLFWLILSVIVIIYGIIIIGGSK